MSAATAPNATIAFTSDLDPHRSLEISRDGEFVAYVHGLRRIGCLSFVVAGHSDHFDTAEECVDGLAARGLYVDRPELLGELLAEAAE
jgi:hypothetical protein